MCSKLRFCSPYQKPAYPQVEKKKKLLNTPRKPITPSIHPFTSHRPAVIYRCTPGAHDITTGRGYMCYKAHS